MKTVEKIEMWLAATGMAKTRLGMLACANPHAIDRIRAGTANVNTLQAVADYIEANPVDE